MANIISRLVRLVLDRASADKTEKDAKKSLGNIESGANRLREAFLRVGAAIAAALSIRALVNFGRAAIREAMASEKAWADLASTVNATGESFAAMEAEVRAAADAFQDATIHGNEDYAISLQRLIALTGDLTASTNNMGLVANVAARFFDGQLGPAVELVGKVMNGNTAILQRMGIAVKDAQEGLEVLATRSMGAAEDRAATFGGRLQQLNELWKDFQKEVGFAMVGTEEATGALDVLSSVVRTLTRSVIENQDTLRTWVGTGLRWTIEALDAVYRTLRGLGELIVGPVWFAMGGLARVFGLVGEAAVLAQEALGRFLRLIGASESAQRIDDMTSRLRENVRALNDWARAAMAVGAETVGDGLRRFTRSSFDFGAPGERPALDVRDPMLAAGAMGETDEQERRADKTVTKNKERAKQTVKAVDEVREAIKRHEAAMADNALMSELWGEDFDALGDQANILTNTLRTLHELGVKPGSDLWQQYVTDLEGVQAAMDATTKATENMALAAEIAGAVMAGALGSSIRDIAKGKARQNAIQAAELYAQALVASFNPFTAGRVPALLAAAKRHTVIAGMWAALGGGGSRSNGGEVGAARGAAGAQAERTERPQQDVTIVLSGPGFHALNPEVQRVVYGAQQEARDRFGPNVNIRTVTR